MSICAVCEICKEILLFDDCIELPLTHNKCLEKLITLRDKINKLMTNLEDDDSLFHNFEVIELLEELLK